jgi:hypothetical protein
MQRLLRIVLSIGVLAGNEDKKQDEAGSGTRACDVHDHPFFVL